MSIDLILWILAALSFGASVARPDDWGRRLIPLGLCLAAITFIV